MAKVTGRGVNQGDLVRLLVALQNAMMSSPTLAVNAGGAAKLDWTAPAQAGDMKFQCDFHVAVGMIGTITVE